MEQTALPDMKEQMEATTRSKGSRAKKVVIASTLAAAVLAGGGTFSLWQESAPVSTESVSIGSMNLAASPGTWTSSISGVVDDISLHRVSPGETMTFTQELDVRIEGDNMSARLEPEGWESITPQQGFTMGELTLSDGSGNVLGMLHRITRSGVFTASTTVSFEGAPGAPSYGSVAALDGVGYKLTQVGDPVYEYTVSNGSELGDALRVYDRNVYDTLKAKFIDPIDVEVIKQAFLDDLGGLSFASKINIDNVDFVEGSTGRFNLSNGGLLARNDAAGQRSVMTYGILHYFLGEGLAITDPSWVDSTSTEATMEVIRDEMTAVNYLVDDQRRQISNPQAIAKIRGTVDGKPFNITVSPSFDANGVPTTAAYDHIKGGGPFSGAELAELQDPGSYPSTYREFSSIPRVTDASFKETVPEPSAELKALLKAANEELLREVVGTW